MPKKTFLHSLSHATDVWRGRALGTRAAARGIWVEDDLGNEILAAEVRFRRSVVTEDPDDSNVAIVDFGGAGVDGGSASGSGITQMLNNSGADLALYDVVVVDETADDAVTTTTTPQDTRIVGVVQAAIADGETGPVLFSGWTPGVRTDGPVTRGDYLETSTTPGAATTNPTRRAGSFAVLTTGGDPSLVTPGGVLDHLIDSATTEYSNAGAGGTGMTVVMPATVPIGMILVLVVQAAAGSAVTTPSGWTRIGSTAGFYVYRRISDGTEGASVAVTWTPTSVAVAHVLVLDGLDLVTPLEGSAFDDTTAAAAVVGLVSSYQLAIAFTRASALGQTGWEDVASGAAAGGGAGGTLDLNNLHGTVTGDHSAGFGSATTPANVNDANDATRGSFGATVTGAGEYRGFHTDLGAAKTITSIRLKSDDNKDTTADELFYSSDNVSWSGGGMGTAIAGSWNGTGLDQIFTPTTPITARYFRYDRLHGGGFASGLNVYSWELRGSDVLVDVDSTVVMKLNAGTPATSPFTGTTDAHDGIVALALAADPFLSITTPAALLYGDDLDTASSSAGDGMVPYLIESGETFTVPVKKQALWEATITVDAGGSLVVDGMLIEVS